MEIFRKIKLRREVRENDKLVNSFLDNKVVTGTQMKIVEAMNPHLVDDFLTLVAGGDREKIDEFTGGLSIAEQTYLLREVNKVVKRGVGKQGQ